MAFDMEAEVRDLCARRDIHDCLCRYMRGQDRLDPRQSAKSVQIRVLFFASL